MAQITDFTDRFTDWFYQLESFSYKCERFYDDLTTCRRTEDAGYAERLMKKWLEAAYIAGAKAGLQDASETLADYGTAMCGIDEKVFSRTEAFDAASHSLESYLEEVSKNERVNR